MEKNQKEIIIKKVIEKCIEKDFEKFSENYDFETEDNFVPYGNTWVNEGRYISDESWGNCIQEYKESFDTAKASEFVSEILAEDDGFLEEIIKLVEETRL